MITRQRTEKTAGFTRRMLAVLVLALLALAGCGRSSLPGGRGKDYSKKINTGAGMLTKALTEGKDPMHLSMKSEQNVNPKFPDTAGSKPVMGSRTLEADVSPTEVDMVEGTDGKSRETKATPAQGMQWAFARSGLSMRLLGGNLLLAFAAVSAKEAGSDNIFGITTDKYDLDTANADASKRAAFAMSTNLMMGGKTKLDLVKGSVWLDQSSGRLVKYDLHAEYSDKEGNAWKEHYEALATPK